MLTPDPCNPAFDATMEVLCVLPLKPTSVRTLDVARDLGMTVQQVRKSLGEIATKLDIPVDSVGNQVCIFPRGWRKAQQMGFTYLDQLEKAVAT